MVTILNKGNNIMSGVLKFFERVDSFDVERIGEDSNDFNVYQEAVIELSEPISWSIDRTDLQLDNYLIKDCYVREVELYSTKAQYYISYSEAIEQSGQNNANT